MSELLFDIPPSPPRKKEWEILKEKYGILTHYNTACEEPWLALWPIEKDKGRDIGDVMAESCRLYDESGMLAEAHSEEDAILELARKCRLTLTLEELK